MKEKNTLLTKSTISSQNMLLVLEVDKTISNIQRAVLVYGTTGRVSVLNNIKKEASELENKLQTVLKTNNDKNTKEVLLNMIKIGKDYRENIEELETRYNYRNTILEEKLPKIINQGTKHLKSLITNYQNKNDIKTVQIAQTALLNWLDIEKNALLFIQKRKYQYKTLTKLEIKKARNLNKNLIKRTKSSVIKENIEQFDKIFDQAIQANRIYLSLVNVVMAGSSSEFATLSNQLKTSTLKTLHNISQKNIDNYNKDLIITISFVFLLIGSLVLLALFYNYNISTAIKNIASVFRSFQNGDFNKEVPETYRLDEIGKLAKAASAFKQVSYQMQEAKGRAESLAKSKDDFLANMSHEIRTPMNGVIGMLSLLEQTKLDETQKDMLKTIESSSTSLLSLLNDILDFNKIGTGNIILESKSFNLHQCLKDVHSLFHGVAKQKGVIFKITYKENEVPKFVKSDITRLKQILINLVSNAIKFTEHGAVELLISNYKTIDENKFLIDFSVIDTGIGISTKSQKELFQAFIQADPSITRKYGGTGLGLSISSKLAKLMNGEILVSSQEGRGSTFKFTVPLLYGQDTIEKINHISNLESNLDGYKVLLVEDNIINQKVLIMILKKLKLQYHLAENGQQAVDLVKKQKYDIIFMDMQMPVLDGVSATKIIRGLNNIEQPYIVAITANAFSSDQKRCIDAGMNHFLPKPISIKAIKKIFSDYTHNNNRAS